MTDVLLVPVILPVLSSSKSYERLVIQDQRIGMCKALAFCLLWGIRSIPALMWYSKCIAYNVERRCNDALVGVLCKICPPGETTGKTFVDPNHPTGFFATAQFTSHRENEHSVKHFKGIICRRNLCATGSHQRSFNSVGASLFCQITPKNSRPSLRNDVTSGIGLNYLHFPKLIPRIF